MKNVKSADTGDTNVESEEPSFIVRFFKYSLLWQGAYYFILIVQAGYLEEIITSKGNILLATEGLVKNFMTNLVVYIFPIRMSDMCSGYIPKCGPEVIVIYFLPIAIVACVTLFQKLSIYEVLMRCIATLIVLGLELGIVQWSWYTQSPLGSFILPIHWILAIAFLIFVVYKAFYFFFLRNKDY